MGCKTSICTDPNELLLSQNLQEKEIDITIPASEKSTSHSINNLLNRNNKAMEPGKPAFLLKSFCKLMLKNFDNSEELTLVSQL